MELWLIGDVLFEENVPAWKTRSGSRMDEKAIAMHHGENVGKRNSDTTLRQDENIEKINEPGKTVSYDESINNERMDRTV